MAKGEHCSSLDVPVVDDGVREFMCVVLPRICNVFIDPQAEHGRQGLPDFPPQICICRDDDDAPPAQDVDGKVVLLRQFGAAGVGLLRFMRGEGRCDRQFVRVGMKAGLPAQQPKLLMEEVPAQGFPVAGVQGMDVHPGEHLKPGGCVLQRVNGDGDFLRQLPCPLRQFVNQCEELCCVTRHDGPARSEVDCDAASLKPAGPGLEYCRDDFFQVDAVAVHASDVPLPCKILRHHGNPSGVLNGFARPPEQARRVSRVVYCRVQFVQRVDKGLRHLRAGLPENRPPRQLGLTMGQGVFESGGAAIHRPCGGMLGRWAGFGADMAPMAMARLLPGVLRSAG